MQKNIVLGVGGGIAAYKAATICSMLIKQGHTVEVLMTKNATQFVQPLTFQALSHRPVLTDTFVEPHPEEIAHIAVADRADMFLIAPATANLIAKLAHGIADDMITTTALATRAPLVIAPAMNVHMLAHPAVVENLQILKSRGSIVIESGVGALACGYTGKGRLAEPEDIVEVVSAILMQSQDLSGLRVLVSAGPTVEDIDPVRFLSNASTGKMGYAIAETAALRGATVTLVSGPTHLPTPSGVRRVDVRSTKDMLVAVEREVADVDVFISAAAPADFRPKERLENKWKKSSGIPSVDLESTEDILFTVGVHKRTNQVFIGFAAETTNSVENGQQKLERKNLDMVVVNDVTMSGAGFGVDTNIVTFVRRDGTVSQLPLMQKHEVAMALLDHAKQLITAKRGVTRA